MIYSQYSSKEFESILCDLESIHGRVRISSGIINNNAQVIKDYNHEELALLISGIKNNKLSAPHSWLETLIFLKEHDGISFVDPSQKESVSLVSDIPASTPILAASNANHFRSWVWYSTDASMKLGQISILSIIETFCAVGVYGWLAFHFQHQWWLIISAIAAPIILMRSEVAVNEGFHALKKYWIRQDDHMIKSESYLMFFLVGISILILAYYAKDKILYEQNYIKLFFIGVGFSSVIIALSGIVMGIVNDTVVSAFRESMPGMGVSFSASVGVAGSSLLIVIFSIILPIIGYMIDLILKTPYFYNILILCIGMFTFGFVIGIIIGVPIIIIISEEEKLEVEGININEMFDVFLTRFFYPIGYAVLVFSIMFFIYITKDLWMVDYLSNFIIQWRIESQQDMVQLLGEFFGEKWVNEFYYLTNNEIDMESKVVINYLVAFLLFWLLSIAIYMITILFSSGLTTNGKIDPNVTAGWILTPVFIFSIWAKTLFIRFYYSIRHPIHGLRELPDNWRNIFLQLDLLCSPEIMPRAGHITPHFTANGLAKEAIEIYKNDFDKEHIKFYAILSIVIYITAFLWRWSLKSTLWLWWILAVLFKSPFYGKNTMQINDATVIRIHGLAGKWLPSLAVILFLWLATGYIPPEDIKFWAETYGENASKILDKLLIFSSPPPPGLRQWSLGLACALTFIIYVLSNHIKIMHKKVLEEEDALNELSEERRNLFLQRAKHLEKWHTARVVSFILIGYSYALYFSNNWYHQEISRFIPTWLINWL